MKSIIFVISIFFLTNASCLRESPRDFDNKLSYIVRVFREEIMDEGECDRLRREAESLAEKIEDAINTKEEYTSDEITQLKILKKEAKALEEFIATVGDCRSNFLSIEYFNLANRRVGATVLSLIKDKYCVDIISVTIDNYKVYLLQNHSTTHYDVNLKWVASKEMSMGDMKMNLTKSSLTKIFVNREKPIPEDLTFLEITCKDL